MYYKIRSFIKKLIKDTPLWKIREFQKRNLLNKKIKYFLSESTEILQKVSATLNENNILFWLEFGTLLGFYREKGFIKHDFDFDFGCFLNDAERVRKVLTENNFVLVREFNSLKDGGREECYLYKHTTIDIFYFRNDDKLDTIFCNTFRCLEDTKALHKSFKAQVKRLDFPNSGFSETEFNGCKINVPKNTAEHLKSHYGDDFMTPSVKYVSHNTIYLDFNEMPGEYIFHKII